MLFFKKIDENSKIWWVNDTEKKGVGVRMYSFDKETIHVIHDYPDKLTIEERKIFEQEAPFWVEWLGYTKKNGEYVKKEK